MGTTLPLMVCLVHVLTTILVHMFHIVRVCTLYPTSMNHRATVEAASSRLEDLTTETAWTLVTYYKDASGARETYESGRGRGRGRRLPVCVVQHKHEQQGAVAPRHQ